MNCKKIMRGILGVTAAAMLFCGCGRKGTGLDDKLTDYKVSGSDSISLEYMNSDDHKFVTIKKDDDKFDEVQKKLNDVFDNAGTKETGFKGEKLDEDFQGPAVSYTTKTSDGDYSIITVDWNTMKGYATLYKTILTSEELNACYSDSGSLNNLGSREELGTYYFEASDTDELNKVFKEYCE